MRSGPRQRLRLAMRASCALLLALTVSCSDDSTNGDGGGSGGGDGSLSDGSGGPPPSDKCDKPNYLDLKQAGGALTVSGTTKGLKDEFSGLKCGGEVTFNAPQSYYSFDAVAKKVYALRLTPVDHPAYVYAFEASVGCTEAAIEKACASEGASGDRLTLSVAPGETRSLYLLPKKAARYIVVVDSYVSSYAGRYALRIEQSDPPDNGKCSSPKTIKLTDGSAKVSGDTGPVADEFPKLECGGSTPLDAGQLYYLMLAKADHAYRIDIEPQFWGLAYLFPFSAKCKESDVEIGCASRGKSGMLAALGAPGTKRSFVFEPDTPGDYLLGIEGETPDEVGKFSIEVTEYTPPSHSTCAKAKALKLGSKGEVTISESTAKAGRDELPSLTCGGFTRYSAPQLYYSFDVVSGKRYDLTLKPKFKAEFYVFKKSVGCTASAINKACGSAGDTGDRLAEPVAAGGTRTLSFRPKTTGTYVVAVDGGAPYELGAFSLTIKAVTIKPPPTHSKCSGAKSVTLSGGKASISDNTTPAVDEFPTLSCRGPVAFAGRQLYYKISAASGKAYRLTFTPTDFWGYLYAFPKSTGCSVNAIDAACGKEPDGLRSGIVAPKQGSTLLLAPSAPGDYIIAVDGGHPTDYGSFKLEIEEIPKPSTPTNSHCNSPSKLTLSGGKVTVSGDTTASADEFTGNISCNVLTAMNGPQVYYSFDVPAADDAFKLTLTPKFPAYLYTFEDGANCIESKVNSSCGSGGTSGAVLRSAALANTSKSLYFQPASAGRYNVAVDANGPTNYGPFSLVISEFTPAANGTCTKAKALTLSSGKVSVSGNTALVKDEYPGLQCGGTTYLRAPQVYYSFTAKAGKSYSFKVTSDHYTNVAIFSEKVGCSLKNIESACGSSGVSGMLSPVIPPGSTGKTFTFKPSSGGDYVVAVDGFFIDDFGSFSLSITER